MVTQSERMEEAYEFVKNSDEHDHQRVVYEVPFGQGWTDAEGYTVEAEVSGEPFLKVIREDEHETIPVSRIIRVHMTEYDNE